MTICGSGSTNAPFESKPFCGTFVARSQLNIKRAFLYLLIASVGVSASIGIFVVLFGDFGEFETRVLLTTLTVTVISILGLACGAAFETGGLRVIPLAGISCAVASGAMWMIMIWVERFEGDVFARAVMTATLLAIACSHISLLSLARLANSFIWARWSAYIAIWSLSGLVLWTIWFRVDPSQPSIARTMGVLSIIIGALTVITPVFHRLSRRGNTDELEEEIANLRERLAALEARRSQIGR